jgi:two-component system sensor histidine kinase MprB
MKRLWSRLSLHARLSFIAAAAVAVAVLAVSGLAWLLVREELYRQLDSQLRKDSQTIAAQPGPWPYSRGPFNRRGGGPHQRDLGPRWQILDRDGRPTATQVLPTTSGAASVATGATPRSLEDVEVDGVPYRMLTVPTKDGAAQVAVAREDIDETLANLGLLLAAGCLAGIAGAALLGRTVARAGLAPVERLTAAVEHVTETNDLQAAIPVTGADEIGRLSRSFNAMLGALESSRAAQRMLVEDAGHELRTPLTSLRTNIELLIQADAEGRPLDEADRQRLLRDLGAQVVELTELSDELIQLARAEAVPEPVEEVELADVVGAAVERAQARAPDVAFRTAIEAVTVSGRPAALERVVLNLLDNAAKWSSPGATVDVALRATGAGGATITVADSGPGIDDADLPHVFERFYRATAARSMPGSGLGLAIVAQTVAQHGGEVTAGRSAAGGALLTVTLPFSSELLSREQGPSAHPAGTV